MLLSDISYGALILGSVVPPISLRSSIVRTLALSSSSSCPCSAWSPWTQHCRRLCSSCHSLRCRERYLHSSQHFYPRKLRIVEQAAGHLSWKVVYPPSQP